MARYSRCSPWLRTRCGMRKDRGRDKANSAKPVSRGSPRSYTRQPQGKCFGGVNKSNNTSDCGKLKPKESRVIRNFCLRHQCLSTSFFGQAGFHVLKSKLTIHNYHTSFVSCSLYRLCYIFLGLPKRIDDWENIKRRSSTPQSQGEPQMAPRTCHAAWLLARSPRAR